jgi:hypothetical protein
VPNGVKVDQRKIDRSSVKGLRNEHPLRNEPLLAAFENYAEMAFTVAMFLAQDKPGSPMQRMVGITKFNSGTLITSSILSLRSPDPRPCSLISPVIPIGSPSQTAG